MKLASFISTSDAYTKKIGHRVAGIFRKMEPHKKALVIGLMGELGSGKTTFVKGFAKGLGVKKIIQSPTFVLVKSYKLQVTNYKLQDVLSY